MARITIRFDKDDEEYIERVRKHGQFTKAEVVRFAVRFLRLNTTVGMFNALKPEDIATMLYGMLEKEAKAKLGSDFD